MSVSSVKRTAPVAAGDNARRAARRAAAIAGTTEHVLAGLPAPIAVVGNATPAHAWGAVLDRYPTVVRLNNFRTRGFEALVGRRTDLWCTSGWEDVAPQDVAGAVSPFQAAAAESAHLAAFAARLGRPVATAALDVRALAPDIPKPSTGLALALLLDALGISADLFLFDGFQTGHYWTPGSVVRTTHSTGEWSALRDLAHVAVHGGPPMAMATLTAPPLDPDAAAEALLAPVDGRRPSRVLVLGEAGPLAASLRARGAAVSTVPHLGDEARHAYGVFTLASLEAPTDVCVLVHLAGRLADHDVRLVRRHARRLAARTALVDGIVRSHPVQAMDRSVSVGPAAVLTWCGEDDVAETAPAAHRRASALPAGYVERSVPEYYEDRDGGVVWQPDVYRLARDLARDLGAGRIVDVGCGQGRKVAALHPELAVVGLDQGLNLDACRSAHPWGRWLEADLERATDLPLSAAELAESVLVCADVIEHLRRPERLLALLAQALRHARCAVLTTPERALTHGDAHMGPPPNPAHVREWTLAELQRLVEDAGLDVAFAGLTASETTTYRRQTSVLVLRGASAPVPRSGHDLGERAAAWLALYDRERGTRPDAGTEAGAPRGSSKPDGLPLQPFDPSASLDVSIVMRTKDRPGLLERAVASVCAQTWTAWQLVVVNDGGDPLVVEAAIRAAAPADPRVTIVHRAASEGMEAATNAGMSAATGTWVTLLDDDDSWEPAFLETCVRHLRTPRGSRVRGVVTHSTRIEETAVGAAMVEQGRTPFTPSLRAVSLAELTQRNLFPVNAFVYERQALVTVGGYRPDLPVLGDWEFNLRFVRHFEVDVIPEALANYHQRPGAASGSFANSPADLHLRYQARLRNEWLRADLDRGVPGLGWLANLATAAGPLAGLLAERDAHVAAVAAMRAEDTALRAEVGRMHEALSAAQRETRALTWQATVTPRARRLAAGVSRRHAGGAVVLVGAGDLADLLGELLHARGLRVAAIGDNDIRKHGTAWRDLAIVPVREALAVDADVVVIASDAHREALTRQARAELGRMGRVRPIAALSSR